MKHILIALIATVTATGLAPHVPPIGVQFYVSPTGKSSGNGSINNPWDLQTALNKGAAIQPGSMIWLRGGTYVGKFWSALTGTTTAPITVRSYTGEWARLDGFKTTTLVASISATGSSITLGDAYSAYNGMTIIVDSEHIQLDGKNGNTFAGCNRGWDGTAPAAHSAGAKVIFDGDVLKVGGSNVQFRSLELFTSDPLRVTTDPNASSAPNNTGAGVNVLSGATGIKLINLIIHDARGGVGAPAGAGDIEVYGCIIYNNGWVNPNRGNGHGLYLQNQDLTVGKKAIDDIVFNNYGFGTHAFGEAGYSNNITFDGVISFNNGSPASYPGNIAGLPTNFRQTNLFAGTAVNPPQNITMKNSLLYHEPGTMVGNNNLSIGYISSGSQNIVVQNNFVAGGQQAIGFNGVQSGQVTGNTFYVSPPPGEGVLASVQSPGGAAITWNNNKYFGRTPIGGCVRGPDRATPFFRSGSSGTCGGAGLDFAEWKSRTGFDLNGTYSTSKPPQAVFVRPNTYEPGRANVVVYNFTLVPFVGVDVSGILPTGSSYEVRNAQDYFAPPVLSGVYNGGTLRLPMTGLSVATPIGQAFTPAPTGPEFNVFVLIRR